MEENQSWTKGFWEDNGEGLVYLLLGAVFGGGFVWVGLEVEKLEKLFVGAGAGILIGAGQMLMNRARNFSKNKNQ